jgi:hypothetical protein
MRADQSLANTDNHLLLTENSDSPNFFQHEQSQASLWLPENYTPLSEPLDNMSTSFFPNATDLSNRPPDSPAVHDFQSAYMTSPASPYPDQPASANAAMTANSQEMQTWFAQSARREGRSRKSFPRRRSLYSRNSGVPIAAPKHQNLDWAALDPLQRWQNSPPENEPASITAINHAVASTTLTPPPVLESASSSRHTTPGLGPQQGFGYAAKRSSRPPSISSLESGTSNGSIDSILSSRSCGSRISASSNNRKNSRTSARVTKTRTRTAPSSDQRPFQCTFCCDTFKNKYDWTRHEKSLHLNPEQWVCTPEGEVITCASTGNPLCAYCLIPQPSREHLESHNSSACAHKTIESRSFKRKDHLIQHIRLIHKIDSIPTIGEWKPPELSIKSRCGFCNVELQDWKTRAEHLSKHFREGKKMLDWKGTHAFEPHIARQVTNAMPPFLIGSESKTPVPFSATKPGHQELLAQITSRAALNDATTATMADQPPSPHTIAQNDNGNQEFKTAWEILTFHLGRFAQERIKAGIVPTDEMFQRESRRLWFDSDDPWDQTFADDTQWMEIFRQEHGLGETETRDAV